MKKKYNILLIIICMITFVASGIISLSNTIVTERQNYLIEAGDSNAEVSNRELAMLASLVYEDVPNSNKYTEKTNGSCINEKGVLINKCFFSQKKAYDNVSLIKLQVKGSKYNNSSVFIEGLSERKMQSVVSKVSAAKIENGQEYYFLNFADVSELKNNGWVIYDYSSSRKGDNEPDNVIWNDNYFDVITFKKGNKENGNDYVIAYRGTDYPDLYEWAADVFYAIDGEHSQAKKAYNYAQSVYDKIIKEDNTAKIYVTGHSLGAYLAQIGGAAIIDKEAGRSNPYKDEVVNSTEMSSYEKVYGIKSTPNGDGSNEASSLSRLEKVVYFNGMGVTGIFGSNQFTDNIDNALVYLATHDRYEKQPVSGTTVNYADDIYSSGRLVLYSMEGDPVSNIGFHYGEIYRLEIGVDAITNHVGSHNSTSNEALTGLVEIIEYIKNMFSNDKVVRHKITESLSTIVSSMISLDNMEQLNLKVPKYVSEKTQIQKYGLSSLLTNVFNGKSELAKKYNINTLFDYANIAHETDSFVCMMDKNNGQIERNNINISIGTYSKNLNFLSNKLTIYNNSVPYKVPGGYKLGDIPELYENTTNNDYLILSADVNGGCAKFYNYEYSLDDGTTWKSITDEPIRQNSIIIPEFVIQDALDKDSGGDESVKLRVTVYYGDKYTELKSKLNTSNGNVDYIKNNIFVSSDGKEYSKLGADSNEYSYMNSYSKIYTGFTVNDSR